MILAEFDNEKRENWLKSQETQHYQLFHECNQLTIILNLISKQDDYFNTIYDLNGNKVITYSSESIVYLPFCSISKCNQQYIYSNENKSTF